MCVHEGVSNVGRGKERERNKEREVHVEEAENSTLRLVTNVHRHMFIVYVQG